MGKVAWSGLGGSNHQSKTNRALVGLFQAAVATHPEDLHLGYCAAEGRNPPLGAVVEMEVRQHCVRHVNVRHRTPLGAEGANEKCASRKSPTAVV